LEGNNSYTKILIILTTVSLFTSGPVLNYYENAFAVEPLKIVPKSLFYLYDNTYLFIFEVCAGNKTINSKDVKIVSDIETVFLIDQAEGDRVLPSKKCRILKVLINTLDPNSISIQIESLAFNFTINADAMERKKLSFKREYVKMGFPTEISIRIIDLLQSDEPLTKKQLQECEQHYDNYVSLKLSDFTSRYLYHHFIGDCVLLFEDPIWKTDELERYELLSKRLAEIKLQQMELKAMIYKPVSIRTLSVLEIGTEGLYLFTFEGCSGDSFVNVDDAVVVSDTQVISLVEKKRGGNIIHAGFCKVFDIKIMAKDPDSILVLILDLMSPIDQMKNGTPVNQVVCKEGLELMIKNHRETPACINKSTIPQLIERGWGNILQDFHFSETVQVPEPILPEDGNTLVESTTSDTNSTTTESTNSTTTESTNSTSVDLIKTNLKFEIE
jgi:hypothetical protein